MLNSTTRRFWSKVAKSPSGCWVWTANKIGDGYGGFYLDGHTVQAHRFSYELAYGVIGAGLVIDHRCHNIECVRPSHLRAVTRKQNAENRKGARRGTASGVWGVSWEARRQRWRARVRHNGALVDLGYFRSRVAAGTAAQEARVRLFTANDLDRDGEFADLTIV